MNQVTQPKPRGRNGGRKSVVAGEKSLATKIVLPESAVRKLEKIGPTVSAAARNLVLAGLYGARKNPS